MRHDAHRLVKAARYDLYRRAVEVAEAASIRHNLSVEVAASIEKDVMSLLANALGLKPEQYEEASK